MKPEDAFNGLQRQELIYKFVEIGKVLLTWAILKNVDMVRKTIYFFARGTGDRMVTETNKRSLCNKGHDRMS